MFFLMINPVTGQAQIVNNKEVKGVQQVEDPDSVLLKGISPEEPIPPEKYTALRYLRYLDFAIKVVKGDLPVLMPGIPIDEVVKALSNITGEENTEEKQKAVEQFLEHIRVNGEAKVDIDGDTDLFDMIHVWRSGVFDPDTQQSQPPSDSPILKDINLLDLVIHQHLGDIATIALYIPSKDLAEAISHITGEEVTEEKIQALDNFRTSLVQAAKDGDIDKDSDFDIFDMIKVFQEGFDPPIGILPFPPKDIVEGPLPPKDDFGPFDNPMELLGTYVNQLTVPEMSGMPFILITEEQLFNALKAVTGMDPEDPRITAVKDFIAQIIKTNEENGKWEGGYADVNGDGATNAKDLIQVYQTGKFDLVGVGIESPPWID